MTAKTIAGKVGLARCGIAAAAVCALAAFAPAVSALAAFAPAASAGALRTRKSGAFAGYGPAGDLQVGLWRGAAVQTGTDYLESDDWREIEDPAWDIWAWRHDRSIQPVFSVPIWPTTGGSPAAAAAGD